MTEIARARNVHNTIHCTVHVPECCTMYIKTLSSGDSGRQRYAGRRILLTCILRIFSTSKGQNIKNIEPESEKQYSSKEKKSVIGNGRFCTVQTETWRFDRGYFTTLSCRGLNFWNVLFIILSTNWCFTKQLAMVGQTQQEQKLFSLKVKLSSRTPRSRVHSDCRMLEILKKKL